MCTRHESYGPMGSAECELCHEQIRKNFNEALEQSALPNLFTSQELKDKTTLSKNVQKRTFLWITVNPKKTVTLTDFTKAIHKMYNRSIITNYYYIYEIGDNQHNHSHGLCLYDAPRHKIKDLLANSVKNVCDVTNDHCFCVRFINEEAAIEKFNYMLGKKQDKKTSAVEATVAWRTANAIQPYYGDPKLVGPPPGSSTASADLRTSRREAV